MLLNVYRYGASNGARNPCGDCKPMSKKKEKIHMRSVFSVHLLLLLVYVFYAKNLERPALPELRYLLFRSVHNGKGATGCA